MSKKLLLVEDEAIIALAEAQTLRKHGYEVVTVYDGETAVETVDADPDISLVLMDIDLGAGMDGTEAAEHILRRHDLPIAFLSSHTEPEVVEKTEGITSYGYIVKNSGETVLLASIRMAFRLHHVHAELKLREHFVNSVFESVQDGISVLNPDLTIRVVNRTMRSWYPESRDFTGRKCYEVYHNREEPCENCPAVRALKTGNTERAEVPGRADSPVEWLELFTYPMKDAETNEISGVVEFVRDITERKRSERELKESEERYRLLYNSLRDAVIVVNENREILDCNSAFTELFGYALEEVCGSSTAMLYASHEEYRQVGQLMRQQDDTQSFIFEARYRTQSGEIFPGEKKIQYLRDENGRPKGFIGLVRDVTERKRREEQTQALAREKENLLKEVQHRVKNTMNTMANMLSLKADSLQDNPDAAAALNDARSRFESMQVLYDQLYRTEHHESSSIRDYLLELIKTVVNLFPAGQEVQLVTDIEDFPLETKRLSEVGIIVNELVTNAMKYAFNEREEGTLRVSAHRRAGQITVTVADDGPGFAGPLETTDEQSFGMTLLYAYAEQLGGTIRFQSDGGTHAILEFPE